ncbi:MAG: alpha/beta fold hydrolase [Acidimicrobiia bacterium]
MTVELQCAPATFVDTGSERLAVRRVGAGPPLLLVHGFPLSGLTWRRVVPTLAAHFHCIVPDLPGLGETEWSTATDFGFPGQGATLRRLVDALGLGSYVVLAQDTGGTFARYLARDDARVRALVLINTEIPNHRPPWIPAYQRLLTVPGTERVLGALLRSRRFVHSGMGFGGCFTDRTLLDGEFDRLFVEPLRADARRLRGVRRYLLGARWAAVDALPALHARLAIPVRLVWGRDDPTFPVASAREMVHQFPAADLVEIDGASLLPHEERPSEVLAAALPLLRGAAGD